MTIKELFSVIREHNHQNQIDRQYGDKNALYCAITFSNESWPSRKKDYSLEERTYIFRSDEKYFIPKMLGNSIFASDLAKTDKCIRLDYYIFDWIVENCFILSDQQVKEYKANED